jgi:hypothetical protein
MYPFGYNINETAGIFPTAANYYQAEAKLYNIVARWHWGVMWNDIALWTLWDSLLLHAHYEISGY